MYTVYSVLVRYTRKRDAHDWEGAQALVGERHVGEEGGDGRLEEQRERRLRVVPARAQRGMWRWCRRIWHLAPGVAGQVQSARQVAIMYEYS